MGEVGMTTKNLTIQVDLLESLKAESKRTGEPVNSIIRRACREFLEREHRDEQERRGDSASGRNG